MLDNYFFHKSITDLIDFHNSKKFLLAVSGGVDSMVMLHIFREISLSKNINFSVAHINYKLRGEDSDMDKKLVSEYCKTNNIPIFIYEVSEIDNKPENKSIQLWARNIRYKFFRKIMADINIDFLVTAHHLDDQLETFLINLSRGSGLLGLRGIPSDDNNIIRPFLNFTKQDIYNFATKNNVPFREDYSNKKNDYLRNKLRNIIIPELVGISENFIINFKKSINILSKSKEFIDKKIDDFLHENSIIKEGYLLLNKKNISEESDFVKYEVMNRFGFNKDIEINKIFSANNGKKFFSKDYTLIIDRSFFILRKISIQKEHTEEINFTFNETDDYYSIIFNKNKEYITWKFDKDKVFPPFKLRKPIRGDKFQPKGMLGKKLVSKFLKDSKIPFLEKDNISIIQDNKNQILGVLPLRQDQRYIYTEF